MSVTVMQCMKSEYLCVNVGDRNGEKRGVQKGKYMKFRIKIAIFASFDSKIQICYKKCHKMKKTKCHIIYT